MFSFRVGLISIIFLQLFTSCKPLPPKEPNYRGSTMSLMKRSSHPSYTVSRASKKNYAAKSQFKKKKKMLAKSYKQKTNKDDAKYGLYDKNDLRADIYEMGQEERGYDALDLP